MDDIYVFIILFLGFLILCRLTKEGFEEMEPGGVSVETEEGPSEVEEMPPMEEEMPPMEEMPQMEEMPPMEAMGELGGFDKRKIFSAPNAPNFGSLLELEQIEYMNRMFSKRNTDPNVPLMPEDSQMPSLSEGTTVPNTMGNGGKPSASSKGGGKEPIELHMVYAEWCGHSQNALKGFNEVMEVKGVMTGSGRPVKFVLTEEQSEKFKSDFKGKIKGFPTFVTIDGNTFEEIDVGDRSKDAILDAVSKL